jgi:hypothetical protein
MTKPLSDPEGIVLDPRTTGRALEDVNGVPAAQPQHRKAEPQTRTLTT